MKQSYVSSNPNDHGEEKNYWYGVQILCLLVNVFKTLLNEIVLMILLSWKFIISYKLKASKLIKASLIFYWEREKKIGANYIQ